MRKFFFRSPTGRTGVLGCVAAEIGSHSVMLLKENGKRRHATLRNVARNGEMGRDATGGGTGWNGLPQAGAASSPKAVNSRRCQKVRVAPIGDLSDRSKIDPP